MLSQTKPLRRPSGITDSESATPRGMSYAEFLKSDDPNQHIEWVDGRVVAMAPVSNEHTDLGVFLLTILQCWV
jgi:Uma2 family endonuclease